MQRVKGRSTFFLTVVTSQDIGREKNRALKILLRINAKIGEKRFVCYITLKLSTRLKHKIPIKDIKVKKIEKLCDASFRLYIYEKFYKLFKNTLLLRL